MNLRTRLIKLLMLSAAVKPTATADELAALVDDIEAEVIQTLGQARQQTVA